MIVIIIKKDSLMKFTLYYTVAALAFASQFSSALTLEKLNPATTYDASDSQMLAQLSNIRAALAAAAKNSPGEMDKDDFNKGDAKAIMEVVQELQAFLKKKGRAYNSDSHTPVLLAAVGEFVMTRDVP